ncbi:MAG: endonuclease/exonuclease/phosphatase family protein [Actinomycetales bacterium]
MTGNQFDPPLEDPSASPDVLRIMTWNVKDMHGDPAAVARVISAAQPDVLCLQEAPRLVVTRNQLAGLARSTGLYFADGGRHAAGTAVLASLRTDVQAVRAHRLPVSGWRTRPRGFVRARVSLPGTVAINLTCLHLGLDTGQRADHVDRMLQGLTDDVPAILVGDLNEPPHGPSWRTLSNWAVDPAPDAPDTFPASAPRSRIDAILVDPRLEVLSYGDPERVVEADVRRGSDHRPVLARVRLPRQDGESGSVARGSRPADVSLWP